jgi:arsenate reductase
MRLDSRGLIGEFLGTALLLYVIVGSGIAAESLSADGAIQLAVHAVAVGAGLAGLIAFLAPVSGAHFNPAVTVGLSLTGDFGRPSVIPYVLAQVAGAVIGVVLANVSFGIAAVAISDTERSGLGLSLSEFIGTFVLVLLIIGLVRSGRTPMIPAAVGAWVAAIIIGTASTGFANPAVTMARMFTDSYTGIAPDSVPAFLIAQFLAALTAGACAMLLFRTPVTTESVLQRKDPP